MDRRTVLWRLIAPASGAPCGTANRSIAANRGLTCEHNDCAPYFFCSTAVNGFENFRWSGAVLDRRYHVIERGRAASPAPAYGLCH